MSKPVVFLAVGCLGVSAFVTQLTLMRELLSVFSGNELVLGIVLGNWLLLMGIGAALGGTAARLRRPLGTLVVGQILVAVLPILDVLLLRTQRHAVFSRLISGYARGAEIGVTETVASCFVLLAPYCLIAGYLLTLACLLLSDRATTTPLSPFGRGAPTPLSPAGRGAGGEGGSPREPGKHVQDATSPHPNPLPEGEGTLAAAGCGQDARAPESIGQVYFLDNVGSVLGGLLLTFVLVHLRSHLAILYVPALLNLLSAFLVAWSSGKRILAAVPVATAVGLVGVMLACNLDQWSVDKEYAPEHVVYHDHSPYGRLVVTESAGQLTFIENGIPLFEIYNVEDVDQVDITAVEEAVHYAMAQRPDARHVLLISGGVSGTAREILKKYRSVERLDYVELDPLILEWARNNLPGVLADPQAPASNRLHVQNTDGRLFVKQTQQRYDVVILGAPGPSTSQLNRLYTREFFVEVKRVLLPDGVLCFSLGSYPGYLTRESTDLIAVPYATARAVFENVEILPCGRNYFLASDGRLTTKVVEQLQQAGIETLYVNDYLPRELTKTRLADVRGAISDDAPINEDFNPILYFYLLRHWMSQFTVRFGLLEAGVLLLLAIYLLRIRPVPLAIFSGGFAASALEVVLLMGAQILYGCVYHQVGLIVTMFMLGLGIGSWAANRWAARWNRRGLAWLGLAIALYAALLPLGLIALGHLGGAVAPIASQVAIPLLTAVLAVLVGMEFPLAARVDYQAVTGTAARLYTADFIGAALGALLVSALLIPVIGVVAVCLLAAGLNVFSAGVIFISGRQ